MTKNKKLVCITGADGCGKSSVATALAARLRTDGRLSAQVVTVWDLIERGDVARALPFEPRRLPDYLAALSSRARLHFLLHGFAEALEMGLASSADVLVLDCYAYKYAACEHAHGLPWSEVRTLVSTLPKPEVVIHLDLDPRVAAARKARFTRYECGLAVKPDAAGFVVFQSRVRAALERFATEPGWRRVDAAGDRSSVLDAAFRAVAPSIASEEAA
jgi:thymidylate kinase